MAVNFNISFSRYVPLECEEAYKLLCDWEDHGRWVPFTKVEMTGEDSFVARTGFGFLSLCDNMVVTERDDEAKTVEIEKTGPDLRGTAGFTVKRFDGDSCVVVWRENITVPYVPKFLRSSLAVATTFLFQRALKNLPKR